MKELKILMVENKISQKELATHIGISQQTLSNYLNDKTQPDFEMLKSFAKFFHTTIDRILGYEVPYLIDKSTLTQAQQELFEKIKNLSDTNCKRASDFIDGILIAEEEKEEIVQKFKRGD